MDYVPCMGVTRIVGRDLRRMTKPDSSKGTGRELARLLNSKLHFYLVSRTKSACRLELVRIWVARAMARKVNTRIRNVRVASVYKNLDLSSACRCLNIQPRTKRTTTVPGIASVCYQPSSVPFLSRSETYLKIMRD